MKSFVSCEKEMIVNNTNVILQVAVLSCLAAVQAQVPVGYAGYAAGYGYPAGYAGLPAGYNAVPAAAPAGVYGGVYGATYDPSVAYANLCELPVVVREGLLSDIL